MKKEKTDIQNIFKFLVMLKPYKKNIIVFIISATILTSLYLPYPWLTKMMIDNVMLRQDRSLLYILLTSIFLLTVLRAIFSSLNTYYVDYISHKMSFDIQYTFYKHLQSLSFSFYDSKEVAEILSRQRDATMSRRLLMKIIVQFTNNLLYLCIIPVIIAMMNWKLALVAGITLPWTIFSFFVLSRIVKKYTKLSAEKQAEFSAKNYEFLLGVREIQALNIKNRILRKVKFLYLGYRKLDMIMRVFDNVQKLIGAIVTAIGILLYTWYGAILVSDGEMTVGELIAFTAFVGYLYRPITSMVGFMVPIQEILVYTKRFYEVFDIKPVINEPIKPVGFKPVKGSVSYKNISFSYKKGKQILKNISFEISAGSTVAIVGKTGEGKSTMMSLMPRFYDPQEGQILIDNINVKEIALNDLRSQISMVMQHPFIFVGTIYENITCGRKGFSKNQVINAAKDANIHKFISELPDGYDTKVGERGAKLSGGEKQRIAIARAFVLDRPILILDEATASIDQNTEKLIQESLARLTINKTTFIIAHRATTIQNADVIMVVENGIIVEKGTHKKLLSQKEKYFQLYYKTGKIE